MRFNITLSPWRIGSAGIKNRLTVPKEFVYRPDPVTAVHAQPTQ